MSKKRVILEARDHLELVLFWNELSDINHQVMLREEGIKRNDVTCEKVIVCNIVLGKEIGECREKNLSFSVAAKKKIIEANLGLVEQCLVANTGMFNEVQNLRASKVPVQKKLKVLMTKLSKKYGVDMTKKGAMKQETSEWICESALIEEASTEDIVN